MSGHGSNGVGDSWSSLQNALGGRDVSVYLLACIRALDHAYPAEADLAEVDGGDDLSLLGHRILGVLQQHKFLAINEDQAKLTAEGHASVHAAKIADLNLARLFKAGAIPNGAIQPHELLLSVLRGHFEQRRRKT